MSLLVNPSTGKVLVHSGKALLWGASFLALGQPDVYIDQSVPDELYLEVTNNNDVDVTFYVTVYDNQDMAFGATSMTIGAGISDEPLFVSLSSSVTSGYIEAYFTADGYPNSELTIEAW